MEDMVSMLEKLKGCYKDKKIFLTGHTGFKGAWMLKTLSILGAHVRGYSLEPYTENDLYSLINGSRICDSIIGDIRDRLKLTDAITDFQPDFVFHLAAQPLVRQSYDMPSETFEVNAIGTCNILDGIRLLDKACTVVLITTDKVYHNNEWIFPYRENDKLGGYDPYSASKACCELVIDSYRNSFFNLKQYHEHKKAIAVGRAGNVIGGGDWSKDRLIPDIIKALRENKVISIRNPNSVRPWQHVLEPVIGYLILAMKLSTDPIKYSEAYNFGPLSSDALPVIKMVELAIDSWGVGEFTCLESKDQPHEAGLLKLDISKANNQLLWEPVLNACQAVIDTIEWYKEFDVNRGRNIESLTEKQIINYISKYK